MFFVEADGEYVVIRNEHEDIVLSFFSENPLGDVAAIVNIMEMVRRSGYKEAQLDTQFLVRR